MFGYGCFAYLTRSERAEIAFLANAREFGLLGWPVVLLAIYFCIANPLLEEAFWRGVFGSPKRRPVLSDIAYGGFHSLIILPFGKVEAAVTGAVFLMIMGYIWRQIANRTGGLRLPIIWHGLGDVAVIVAIAVVAFYR